MYTTPNPTFTFKPGDSVLIGQFNLATQTWAKVEGVVVKQVRIKLGMTARAGYQVRTADGRMHNVNQRETSRA